MSAAVLVSWIAMGNADGQSRGPHRAAQNPPSGSAASRADLQSTIRFASLREQVRELQAAVAGMRSDWQQARAETAELRRELDEVRAGAAASRRRLAGTPWLTRATTLSNAAAEQPLRKISKSREFRKIENQTVERRAASFGRRIPVAERKSRRSVSDESRERVQIPRYACRASS